MDEAKVDVIDLIIEFLREHEKMMSSHVSEMGIMVENLRRVVATTLCDEKLLKLEGMVEFMKVDYAESKNLGTHVAPTNVITDLDKILEVIRK